MYGQSKLSYDYGRHVEYLPTQNITVRSNVVMFDKQLTRHGRM